MVSDVEMHHAPAVVRQDDQDKQHAKRRGRDGKEINRRQLRDVTGQKGTPGR
jgi:hypothetical protein